MRKASAPRAPSISTRCAAGAIGADHLLGEIGAVIAGTLPGRTGDADVTIYKSLGAIVQDLAAARHIVAALARTTVITLYS